MVQGVSAPSLICIVFGRFLARSWWFLAVLGRFLLFWGADSAMCAALLANDRNECKKRFVQRVPKTTAST